MSEIPPRPWRIDSGNIIRAADGQSIANVWPGEQWAWAARDLIVRLVNSEAQAVELLERWPIDGHEGDEETGEHYETCDRCAVDALLASLRGEQEQL